MEHHPFWHVGTSSLGDPVTHYHEAAHGWFGDGVRIACWEDFVLSEGTASYLAARAMAAVDGVDVWPSYQADLDAAIAAGDTVALPSTCNAIDLLHDPLWSDIPYMKGAFFLRAVEQQVGQAAFDAALKKFYQQHVGQAATMQQLLDTLHTETGFDPTALADGWLRSLGHP
jgi:aminopeptidase N